MIRRLLTTFPIKSSNWTKPARYDDFDEPKAAFDESVWKLWEHQFDGLSWFIIFLLGVFSW